MKKNNIYIISIFFLLVSHLGYNQEKLNLGVIGLVHDHVNWILNYKSENLKIVGIVEKNVNSINRYKKKIQFARFHFF